MPLGSMLYSTDVNIGRRPARFITEPNMARLVEVRSLYDPVGRFHSWMGREGK